MEFLKTFVGVAIFLAALGGTTVLGVSGVRYFGQYGLAAVGTFVVLYASFVITSTVFLLEMLDR